MYNVRNCAGVAQLVEATDLSSVKCGFESLHPYHTFKGYIMKIYGPYKRKDGRWQITTKKDNGKITSISYPKYLFENYHKIKLKNNETIDHIDNNPDNNKIENLQILSRSDNAKKSVIYAETIELVCKFCGKVFKRRKALEYYDRHTRMKDGPFCSKRCVGKIHH